MILAHAFRNKSAFEATLAKIKGLKHDTAAQSENQAGELTLRVRSAHGPAVQAEYANLNRRFSEFRVDGVYNPVPVYGPFRSKGYCHCAPLARQFPAALGNVRRSRSFR